MAQEEAKNGIFMNGKGQVAEMLQHMTSQERKRFLAHIKTRNPALAEEIEERSFSFEDIFSANNSAITLLIKATQAPIMGIALKGLKTETQKKILSLAERNYAEEAYRWMLSPLSDEKRDVKRAQEKIIAILAGFPNSIKQQFYA